MRGEPRTTRDTRQAITGERGQIKRSQISRISCLSGLWDLRGCGDQSRSSPGRSMRNYEKTWRDNRCTRGEEREREKRKDQERIFRSRTFLVLLMTIPEQVIFLLTISRRCPFIWTPPVRSTRGTGGGKC
jgi:hypothetical protein